MPRKGRVKGTKNKNRMVVTRDSVPPCHDSSSRHISLTRGQYAIVDVADFDWLNQWNWCAMWMPRQKKYYAVRRETGEDGKTHPVLMHRLIMDCPKGLTVDHQDRSGLNNKRGNLRIATYSQQNCNRYDSRGSSRFKGVSWHAQKQKWRVRIKLHGKTTWLGYFRTEEEGAAAYQTAAEKLHGEFFLAGERG